ncbi:anacyclamide/piricyclamide family prenylated cyclic peptide [Planktothrix agardhii]|uniref:anacyclamide/piricyclamide family prenylated cyclic peptide n=1 Tax=Planktothrix agardhii TaxID=1160 RepID=UPI001F32D3B7|nr:anacyclamide/piricyclamide family prenylated cyclic peptide [Planktothrix agardhii]MCF3572001.1 anacyclamide/piricyclamide family prenylated cyclic peptide [Planktothrix agardhii 1805]MCF3585107.1 anacyclamide/piricyclamide family prenylated cyclic peptide [Planktothrix agardhii 1803]
MTKKNLKPQQAAPVQREINTTSSESGTSTGLTPHSIPGVDDDRYKGDDYKDHPFAGDDAE